MDAPRQHGELVDRLMARISELEVKLYDKDLGDAHFTIPAIHGAPPSPHTAAANAASQLASGVNTQLLDSLGDPDKPSQQQQQQQLHVQLPSNWRAAASSWIAASPLARSALGSFSTTSSAQAQQAAGGAVVTAAGAAGGVDATEGKGAARGSSSSGSGSTEAVGHTSSAAGAAAAAAGRTSGNAASVAAPTVAAAANTSTNSGSGPSFTFQPKQHQQPTSTDEYSHTSSTSTSPNNHRRHQHSKTKSDNARTGAGGWTGLKSYILSPAAAAGGGQHGGDGDSDYGAAGLCHDVQRVQEAAGAALAEANERLLEAELRVQAAQAAQRQLQQRLDAAEQLQQDIDALKTENLEAWRQKYEVEGQLATARANMQGLQGQTASMQQELEGLRQQAQIRSDGQRSEGDRLGAEVQLLNEQLMQRSAEATSLREQLTEARAERDRALQEKQQALEERDRLQQQLLQVSGLQQQLAAATSAAAESAASAAEFQEKFMRERAVRRRLHEQLQVLRGNIRVMCRVRPAQRQPAPTSPSKFNSGSTTSSGRDGCISVPLEGLLVVNDVSTARQREFEFDAVFGPDASQQQVFEEVSPMVRSCADGYNVCILAYGQTGSGKTHTMEGPADNPGINSRALQELFKIAADEGEAPSPWSFSVSMMEIYNDTVRDLLAPCCSTTAAGAGTAGAGGGGGGAFGGGAGHGSSNSSNSNMAQTGVHGGCSSSLDVSGLPAGELPAHMDRVPGLVWRDVRCAEDVTAVLREGWRARATAATALNATSSRSHAVLCVKVRGQREGRPFTSLLHLVDLAGSERVDRSEVAGQQLKEAQAINKSLSALGDVVAALQRRSPHIPFRNSKLTQVLQDSLCGSSKVLLVCNLSPEAVSCAETLSSLTFASRAAQVELGQTRRAPAAVGASVAAASDGGAGGQQPGRLSPEPSSSSSLKGGAGSSGDARGSGGGFASSSNRAKSPSMLAGSSGSNNSPGSPSRATAAGGGGSGGAGAAAASGSSSSAASRPVSRLSDRTSGNGPGLTGGSGGGAGLSPRVGAVATKPARH